MKDDKNKTQYKISIATLKQAQIVLNVNDIRDYLRGVFVYPIQHNGKCRPLLFATDGHRFFIAIDTIGYADPDAEPISIIKITKLTPYNFLIIGKKKTRLTILEHTEYQKLIDDKDCCEYYLSYKPVSPNRYEQDKIGSTKEWLSASSAYDTYGGWVKKNMHVGQIMTGFAANKLYNKAVKTELLVKSVADVGNIFAKTISMYSTGKENSAITFASGTQPYAAYTLMPHRDSMVCAKDIRKWFKSVVALAPKPDEPDASEAGEDK